MKPDCVRISDVLRIVAKLDAKQIQPIAVPSFDFTFACLNFVSLTQICICPKHLESVDLSK